MADNGLVPSSVQVYYRSTTVVVNKAWDKNEMPTSSAFIVDVSTSVISTFFSNHTNDVCWQYWPITTFPLTQNLNRKWPYPVPVLDRFLVSLRFSVDRIDSSFIRSSFDVPYSIFATTLSFCVTSPFEQEQSESWPVVQTFSFALFSWPSSRYQRFTDGSRDTDLH
jgi:hypothetical protein